MALYSCCWFPLLLCIEHPKTHMGCPVEKQIFHYLLSNITRMVNNNTRNTENAGTWQQVKQENMGAHAPKQGRASQLGVNHCTPQNSAFIGDFCTRTVWHWASPGPHHHFMLSWHTHPKIWQRDFNMMKQKPLSTWFCHISKRLL